MASKRSLRALDWSRFRDHVIAANLDRGTPGQRVSVRQAVWDTLCGKSGPVGLLLTGTPGGGKTHLGMGMVVHRVLQGRPARWIHWPRLLADQKALFGVGDADGNRRDLVGELGAFDGLLVVDEIGAGMGTDWAQGELYRLLDLRLQMSGGQDGGAALVVTTNVGGREFVDTVGSRQASRLFELCRLLPIIAPDFRQELALRGHTGGAQ